MKTLNTHKATADKFTSQHWTDEKTQELLDLINEQELDAKGLQGHGEYLGGNGQTEWHHVSARDDSGHGEDTSEDSDMTGFERELMSYFVSSHQDSIEDNGQYIIRSLSHWDSHPVIFDASQRIGTCYTFNGDTYAKRVQTHHERALFGTAGKGKRTRKQTARKNSPEAMAGRKAKRLAKLAARRG